MTCAVFRPWPSDDMRQFRSSDGLSLAFMEWGSGPPLLCLAGLTRNSMDFRYLAAKLPNARIIAPDYRGRGESDWDPDPFGYTPAVEARDAVELLDHLGLEKAPILGTSRGGIVAMVLAATARNRISGAILNDIGPEIEAGGLERIKHFIGRNPRSKTMEDAAQALAVESSGFDNVPRSRWRQECRNRYRQAGDRLEITYDPGLRDSFLAALEGGDADLWPLFSALRGMPAALIRGAASDLLSAETAAKMRLRHPQMSVTEVPGRGHCPFLDEPECLAAVRALMAQAA